MKKTLKRTAALLTVLLVLLGMVQLPVSADQFRTNGEPYVVTRGIGEYPLDLAVDELYKGVTYYGWATLKDGLSGELVSDSDLTAKAEIIDPEGKTVRSISIDCDGSDSDTLPDSFGMNRFYLDFVPDMLGTWIFSVTYLEPDGTERYGPYTVSRECVVPNINLKTWFSPDPMNEGYMLTYAKPGDEIYFNYKLTYWNNRQIMHENVEGFTIDIQLYAPDGTHWTPEMLYPVRALNSVKMPLSPTGTWSVVVTLRGDVNTRSTVKLKVPMLGDVNEDGVLDASDAAEILTECARIGSGQPGSFFDSRKTAADFNQDGIMDASDAAQILEYAAADGVGS